MPLLDAVTIVGLVLSVASFVAFLALAFGWGLKTTTAPARAAAERAAEVSKNLTSVTADELTAILKAVAALGEGLVKAGPSLAALIASILFLTVAMISSGGIRSDPPASPTKPAAQQTSTTGSAQTGQPAGGAGSTTTTTKPPTQ